MKKILVVEDNDANMYLISFILKRNGFHLLEARTGIEGVKTAVWEKPDLVIMDIQLPDINGLEAAKRIQANMVDTEIQIIALTSYAMTGDREMALAAGCNGYIEKPINPETFLSEIKKFL